MTILNITEIINKNIPKQKAIKEAMDIYIEGIVDGLSRRNGMIYALCGSGGSGKTNLLLSLFKSNKLYKNKWHNIYYFIPETSFKSISNHPFKDHDKLYHSLTVETLSGIIDEIEAKKNDEKEKELEYSCIIIDDFASSLKNNDLMCYLSKTLTRARHLQCSFIFTLQNYLLLPLTLRKQLTYISLFKPKNKKEFETVMNELIQLNKEDSLILSNYVFSEAYSHLDIDTFENKTYKNFNLLEFTEE